MFYQISFVTSVDNNYQAGPLFNTIKAARHYAKWLATQGWATNVQIFRGGVGGELVA